MSGEQDLPRFSVRQGATKGPHGVGSGEKTSRNVQRPASYRAHRMAGARDQNSAYEIHFERLKIRLGIPDRTPLRKIEQPAPGMYIAIAIDAVEATKS